MSIVNNNNPTILSNNNPTMIYQQRKIFGINFTILQLQ